MTAIVQVAGQNASSGDGEEQLDGTFIHAQSLSHVQQFAKRWTVTHQALLSMEFSRQEYWSRLPFPTAVDLLDPGIETVYYISYTGRRILKHCATWEAPIK